MGDLPRARPRVRQALSGQDRPQNSLWPAPFRTRVAPCSDRQGDLEYLLGRSTAGLWVRPLVHLRNERHV